jgi:hypothetical protein
MTGIFSKRFKDSLEAHPTCAHLPLGFHGCLPNFFTLLRKKISQIINHFPITSPKQRIATITISVSLSSSIPHTRTHEGNRLMTPVAFA